MGKTERLPHKEVMRILEAESSIAQKNKIGVSEFDIKITTLDFIVKSHFYFLSGLSDKDIMKKSILKENTTSGPIGLLCANGGKSPSDIKCGDLVMDTYRFAHYKNTLLIGDLKFFGEDKNIMSVMSKSINIFPKHLPTTREQSLTWKYFLDVADVLELNIAFPCYKVGDPQENFLRLEYGFKRSDLKAEKGQKILLRKPQNKY